jgi:hypothetical protein
MGKLHPAVMLIVCLFMSVSSNAQDTRERADKILSFPSRFLQKTQKKYTRLETRISRQSEQALRRFAKQEKKLQKKVCGRDSAAAKQLFDTSLISYKTLISTCKQQAGKMEGRPAYIPFLDTLTTSLQFLEQHKISLDNTALKDAAAKLDGVSSRLHKAEQIQQLINNRRQYLKEQLGRLQMTKALRGYAKQAYYYEAQVNEYRALLKQPEKWEQKAVDLLSKTKPFKTFMERYSIIGSIFQAPVATATPALSPLIAGAQTSSQVSAIMQQAVAGPNASPQLLQAGIAQAQDQLKQLTAKITGAGGSDEELRDFKPNNQKVKSFLKRIEIGTNLQSTRSNAWLPAATQWGLSAGYKLNDRSIVGMGVAGSLGWGQNIRRIKLSYEGVSARSYLDWKLKGSFWISAGYELNYQQTIASLQELKALDAWQQSALVGISKKYNISKKFKGKMSLLWDGLSYRQQPRTQPLIFRFGYSIK